MTNIGVFDSGVGGLTVLSKLVANIDADYIYFGDTKRAPYGPRDKDEIINYTEEIVDFLEVFDIDTYVIACNTISVLATELLASKYQKNFIPITHAGVMKALDYEGDFLVLATKTTVDSHFYKNEIESKSASRVYEVAAPKLVTLIEAGKNEGEEMDRALSEYLSIANDKKIPNIILGCTHFPLATEAIRNNLTYDANIIDPADKILADIDIKEDKKKSIKIFMSELGANTKSIIATMIDSEYELGKKEL